MSQRQPLLGALMEVIRDGWPFTKRQYPALADLEEGADLEHFALKHLLFHIMKAVGTLATHVEEGDHYRHQAGVGVNTAIVKLVIAALRMAVIRGISPEQIENLVRDILKPSAEPHS